jgi:hypothetical protein
LHWMLLAWIALAVLFFVSGRFVRWMLKQVANEKPPISDREHENELFRAAMVDASAAAPVQGPQRSG